MNMTRADMIYSMQYLDSESPFRYDFTYNNFMYSAAGYLSGKIAGAADWEEFISDTLLKPLEMNSTTTNLTQVIESSNYAVPFGMIGNKLVPYDIHINDLLHIIAPAGSISSRYILCVCVCVCVCMCMCVVCVVCVRVCVWCVGGP